MSTASIETRVNTVTAGDQWRPDAASFADGSYIVAWTDDTTGHIKFQRYAASGSPLGIDGMTPGVGEGQANAVPGNNEYARVTTLSNGNFVVTWTALSDQDGSSEGIYARLFAANGTPIGTEIQVNT